MASARCGQHLGPARHRRLVAPTGRRRVKPSHPIGPFWQSDRDTRDGCCHTARFRSVACRVGQAHREQASPHQPSGEVARVCRWALEPLSILVIDHRSATQAPILSDHSTSNLIQVLDRVHVGSRIVGECVSRPAARVVRQQRPPRPMGRHVPPGLPYRSGVHLASCKCPCAVLDDLAVIRDTPVHVWEGRKACLRIPGDQRTGWIASCTATTCRPTR